MDIAKTCDYILKKIRNHWFITVCVFASSCFGIGFSVGMWIDNYLIAQKLDAKVDLCDQKRVQWEKDANNLDKALINCNATLSSLLSYQRRLTH